jgi:pimeloyl-ACP methyl ester carboxylesterase
VAHSGGEPLDDLVQVASIALLNASDRFDRRSPQQLRARDRGDSLTATVARRPGFGLSEPVPVPRKRFRQAAVEFLEEVVDQLGLETTALAGQSMGGTWALWYALARPERVRRLVLVGSARSCRALAPRRRCESWPPAISLSGFRRSMRLDPDELRRLTVPTLVIWGDHDPVGAVEVGQATAKLMPDARLEVLPAGHVPYLANPDRVAELLSGFVRSAGDVRAVRPR